MTRKKKIYLASFAFLLFGSIIIYTCSNIIDNAAKGKLYTDVKSIPYNRVGLLLGISKYTETGDKNLYYNYRIEAAVKLVKEQKIKYLVVSGDNRKSHNYEPLSMRKDLIAAGVNPSVIYLDSAGFRTFDSVVRLKEIFGQDSATVISQPFHNERAIYIASKKGLVIIGFNATDLGGMIGFKNQCREKLARVKVFLDFLFGKEPKMLGKKISMPKY